MNGLAARSERVRSRYSRALVSVVVATFCSSAALADEPLHYQRSLLPRLLDQLAYSIPDGIALKSIRQSGMGVKVVGYAGSSAKVNAYAKELDRSDLQMNIEVANIRDSRIGANRFSEFSIELSPKDASSYATCQPLPPALDAGRDFDATLLAVNYAGIGNSVEFEVFKPGNPTAVESYTGLPTAIKVIGTFGDIRRFVHEINRLPTLVVLGDFAIQETRDEAVRMEATVTIYRAAAGKQVPAVATRNPGACSTGVAKVKFLSDPFSRAGL